VGPTANGTVQENLDAPSPGFDLRTVHPVASRESSVIKVDTRQQEELNNMTADIRCHHQMARHRGANGDGLQIWRVKDKGVP
jgi:hypothetical protein